MTRAEKIAGAQEVLVTVARYLAENPNDDIAWRDLCRARATLRALARCARWQPGNACASRPSRNPEGADDTNNFALGPGIAWNSQ